ncbi:phosphotransferase [Rhizobium sp. CFBP 8762]|uniref:ABC1 kinase family protein n=1 Tax=Rhizobium sp. CFBP 8762 TaxID=2775279 RepID=UPI00178495ED|nr:AarF/UbiB family protein [Rhizobium sp. CFBP 8762]MBD8553046.1 phosphotransferase [Rhizobium sp. CFBP 8762]
MLETLIIAARDRKRLSDIATILVRFGLADIVERLGITALPGISTPDDVKSLTFAERLRRAIEALGPTFIKLGQILSTRADLLPPDLTQELEKLQAKVPPIPWADIEAQVEADLGAAPETVFAEFDREPLASASIAQVYRARLKTGEAVVVKVRRSGLRQIVDADLRLLAHAATLAEKTWPELQPYQPRAILRNVGEAIMQELDLAHEGRNCEDVARNFADQPDIVFPKIYWDYTGERLLVQDFIDGTAPARDGRLEARGLDGKVLAERGSRAFLKMALIDGLFHGDPHPGNLLALRGNRIGFIDFGMVGRISDKRRQQLLSLVAAIVAANAEQVTAVLLDWSRGTHVDFSKLEDASQAFIARHGHARLDLGQAITDFMALARENSLVLPADLAILFKALITADGVMKRLDPDFDVIASARPLVENAMRARFYPDALQQQAQRLALDLHGVASDLPALFRLLLYRLRQGRIGADISVTGLDGLGEHIERAATRLALSVVIAAFALGLAPGLMNAGPELFGIPVFALAGCLVILAGIAWLLGLKIRK